MILIVDDEPAIRSALRRIVRHFGFEVLEAEDARQALDVLEGAGRDPSAAILDYMMPQMGGVELARKLRGLYPTLPVLILSGGVLDDDLEAAIDEGLLWAYGHKPWDLGWIRAALPKLVAGEAPPPLPE